MLTKLRRLPLLAGAAEILADLVLYLAAVLVVIVILGQAPHPASVARLDPPPDPV